MRNTQKEREFRKIHAKSFTDNNYRWRCVVFCWMISSRC